MSAVFGLIRTVFEWALFLTLVGGIGDATAKIYREANHARLEGLVSLSTLNHALGMGSVTPPTRPAKR